MRRPAGSLAKPSPPRAAGRGEVVKKAALVLAAVGLGAAIARAPEAAPAGTVHPRLLVAERDPFSGLPALRARWAAGERPSDDLPGWALSYLLSGDESYARRAVEAVALYAVEGEPTVESRAAPMREKVRRALDNVLDSSDFVTPDGGYHESMDYMRITFAPLELLAEMRRTRGQGDPAQRYGVFAHMGGDTYLYKVEPDGTTSRDDDNEWPHLQALDNVVLGYAIHRFKDPFAAWIQRESGWLPKEWTIPVL